jgi:hypothetical protein
LNGPSGGTGGIATVGGRPGKSLTLFSYEYLGGTINMYGENGVNYNQGSPGSTITSIVSGTTYTSTSGDGGDSGASSGGSNGLLIFIKRENNITLPTANLTVGQDGSFDGATGDTGAGGAVGINSVGKKGIKGINGNSIQPTMPIILAFVFFA